MKNKSRKRLQIDTKALQNLSVQYSMMLLAEGLVRVIELWDQDHLAKLPVALMEDQVPTTLVQILNRTLMDQTLAETQTASNNLEGIAYAILTLKAIATLPWPSDIADYIQYSIEHRQRHLLAHSDRSSQPQYLWVEKVTYGSSSLAKAYYLAAVQKVKKPYPWDDRVKHLFKKPERESKKIGYLFTKLDCFHAEPAWKIRASILEGLMFLDQLRSSQINLLGGQQSAKNEYLAFIPCTWVVVNNVQGHFLDANLLWSMMVLTLGNFRVDEYMETTLAKLDIEGIEEMKNLIKLLCQDSQTGSTSPSTSKNGEKPMGSKSLPPAISNGDDRASPSKKSALASTSDTKPIVPPNLSHYIHSILTHPLVLSAPAPNNQHLRATLSTFLTSHLSQSVHNIHFRAQNPPPSSNPAGKISTYDSDIPFTTYLSNVGAPSVSALFSFAYLSCMIGGLPDAFVRHLAADLASRVAVMSRLYNDLGSMMRDREERNVSCLNFREFHDDAEDGGMGNEKMIKSRVEAVARYEREAMSWVEENLVSALGQQARGRKGKAVKLFAGVSRLYADVYVVRDLSNRVG